MDWAYIMGQRQRWLAVCLDCAESVQTDLVVGKDEPRGPEDHTCRDEDPSARDLETLRDAAGIGAVKRLFGIPQ